MTLDTLVMLIVHFKHLQKLFPAVLRFAIVHYYTFSSLLIQTALVQTDLVSHLLRLLPLLNADLVYLP